jgi:hypothetical protein
MKIIHAIFTATDTMSKILDFIKFATAQNCTTIVQARDYFADCAISHKILLFSLSILWFCTPVAEFWALPRIEINFVASRG